MNAKTIKKMVSKAILAGLIVSIMPIHLSASQAKLPTNPPSTWQTKKPTKAELDNMINTIKKTRKKIKLTKAVLATLLAGGAIATTAAGIAIFIVGIVIAGPAGAAAAAASEAAIATAAAAAAASTAAVGTTMAAIVAGSATATAAATASTAAGAATGTVLGIIIVGLMTGAAGVALVPILFGGLTAAQLIHTFSAVATIKKFEQQYPGALSTEQLEEIKKFNKTVAGPFMKGILTGMRLNRLLKLNTTYALGQHPELVAHLNGSKKAPKIIKKYLKKSKSLNNVTLTMNAIENKIKSQKVIRDKHKNKLSWGYNKENIKLIAMKLDIKRTYTKLKLKDLSGDVAKLERKYPMLKNLQSIVQKYIQEATAIVTELTKK